MRLIAKSIWDRWRLAVELDDLIGYGMIGLLNAVQRFDPARGTLLKTYAEHRIRGAILDGLRGMDWLSPSARQRARQDQQRRCGIETVSAYVPRMQLVFAWGNLGDLERLSEKKGLYDSTRSAEGNPESLYERKEARGRLTDAISRLSRRHRQVIELYYRRELSMKQIGHILNVHESRVSQLHAAAIQRLRNDPALRDRESFPRSPKTRSEPIRGSCVPDSPSIG